MQICLSGLRWKKKFDEIEELVLMQQTWGNFLLVEKNRPAKNAGRRVLI